MKHLLINLRPWQYRSYCISNCASLSWFSIHLITCRTQKQFSIFNTFKFRMTFIVWIAKMFDFCHREFTYSQKTRTWGNFISKWVTYEIKRLSVYIDIKCWHTNLSCCKWKTSLIKLKKAFEVYKNALSCFRSQKTGREHFHLFIHLWYTPLKCNKQI